MNPTADIRSILVPHDFSESAEYALTYALSLAKTLGARVILLHVYHVPTMGYSEAFATSDEFAVEVERVAGKVLGEIGARARQTNPRLETVLRRGSPWAEIIDLAEQTKADLIVMGTHGRKGLPRLFLGSVAEKVVRIASCPVLTVHPRSAHQNASAQVADATR